MDVPVNNARCLTRWLDVPVNNVMYSNGCVDVPVNNVMYSNGCVAAYSVSLPKTRHDDAEQAGAGMVYMPMLLTCSFVQIVVMWVQASCRVAVFAQHHVDQLDLSISPIEFLQKQFTDMTTQECRNVLGTVGACS